jgi:hypothetical protein
VPLQAWYLKDPTPAKIVARRLRRVAGMAAKGQKNRPRTIPLSDTVTETLVGHVGRYELSPDGLLFTNTLGRPLARNYFADSIWNPVARPLGLAVGGGVPPAASLLRQRPHPGWRSHHPGAGDAGARQPVHHRDLCPPVRWTACCGLWGPFGVQWRAPARKSPAQRGW